MAPQENENSHSPSPAVDTVGTTMDNDAAMEEELYEKFILEDLIPAHFRRHDVVASIQKESYEHFIHHRLQKIIEEEPVIKTVLDTSLRVEIQFSQVYVDSPYIIDEKRKVRCITPNESRLRDLTYSSTVSVDVHVREFLNNKLQSEKILRKIAIAKIPTMIGTTKCNLYYKTEEEKRALGECEFDKGGYFIIKGKERVIVSQERGNLNHVYVFSQKPNVRYRFVAEIRSCSEENGHSVLVQMRLYPSTSKITVVLPFFTQEIPLTHVLLVLDVNKDRFADLYKDVVLKHEDRDPKDEHVLQVLFRTMNREYDVIGNSKEKAMDNMSQYITHSMIKDVRHRRDHISNTLTSDMFPHLGIFSESIEKSVFLMYMLNKLLLTNLGKRPDDDRDHLNNKRFETTGYLMSELFRALYKRVVRTIEPQIQKKHDISVILNRTSMITQGMKTCFSTGNWGIPKSNYIRCGVSQILNRLSYNATLSHLRRIVIPIGKEGKNAKIRQIHSSQFGFICANETSEGQGAGIIKNFTLMSRVSYKVDSSHLRNVFDRWFKGVLLDISGVTGDVDRQTHFVFLNGRIIGRVYNEDVPRFERGFYSARLLKLIPYCVTMCRDTNLECIYIMCDDGRVMRPVWNLRDFSCDDIRKDLFVNKMSWDDLVEGNRIVYVDSYEVDNAFVCMNLSEMQAYAKQGQQCDFMEIHPSLIFGICIHMIPYVDHIQAPRITYQGSMGKQAIGMYSSNNPIRCDTVVHCLQYPERPLVRTHFSEMLNGDKLSSGSNLIVAIMNFQGFNQEDSAVFNLSAIQRGLFRCYTYRTVTAEEKKRSNSSNEVIEYVDPSVRNTMYNYSKLDDRGLVRVGAFVGPNDVIVGKTIVSHKKGAIQKTDNSVVIRNGEEGFVDRIFESVTPDGYLMVKIKLRCERIPELGDKLACYDPETEVLTSSGWKNVSKVSVNDKVACLVNGNELHYLNPTETQSFDYEGKMYLVQSKKVDLCVTPNHRMYTGNRLKKKFDIRRADEIYGQVRSYKNNVENYVSDDIITRFVLPGYGDLPDLEMDLEAWCVFIGIWYAEGSCSVRYHDDGRVHYRKVGIAANKQRVRDALKICMEKLKFNWNIHMSRGELTAWYCADIRLINYLKPLSVGAINKNLPDWCFQLDQYHTRKLIDGMVLGDGNFMEGTTTVRYYTSSIRLRDDFQRLCVHAGYGCNFYLKTSAGTKSKCLGKDIQTTADYWTLTIIKTQVKPNVNDDLAGKGIQQDSWVDYKGKVYCCTVPTKDGVIFVRRNGKSVWSGNSRSAQKGTIGMVLRQEDMPFTSEGITPDVIINPLAFSSRMTINQLLECIAAKGAVHDGNFVYSTPFSQYSHNIAEKLSNALVKNGYERYGNETMYNGCTGEKLKSLIFIGPTYIQRLKHMVALKIHARDHGSVQSLVRQPLEGRSKEGGLRFGEMERDCVGDTPILQMNGLSFNIKEMSSVGHCVMGWSQDKGGLVYSLQTGFKHKGQKECVEIFLEDGRRLVCTPDHPLLKSDGEWVRAKDCFRPDTVTRLKVSVNFPYVNLENEMKICDGWKLDVGDYTFKTDTIGEMLRTFAFARIIGILITDGTIEKQNLNARVYLEHKFDVDAFCSDLALAFGRGASSVCKIVNYTVRLPSVVTKSIVLLKGIVRGNKTEQEATLPSFVLQSSCPLPVIREFLGGFYGGDGHSPVLGMRRGRRDALTSISFTKSSKAPYTQSVRNVLSEIQSLLSLFNIHSTGLQNSKETTNSKTRTNISNDDRTLSETLLIKEDEFLRFHEKIGFRYCIHKSLRLEAAVSYKRLRANVIRQFNWLVDRVGELSNYKMQKMLNPKKNVKTAVHTSKALKELLQNEPLYHQCAVPKDSHDFSDHLIKGIKKANFSADKFPIAGEYMQQIDAYEWFMFKNPNGSMDKPNNKVCFGIKQEENAIPTMNLKVLDVRAVGMRDVYDIQVENTNSFVANGVVVHNCMISHGVSRFLNERLFDLSDKFQIVVCSNCGNIPNAYDHCSICDQRDSSINLVDLPYACKLLFQELMAIGIKIHFVLKE